jgi:hypothetical protein
MISLTNACSFVGFCDSMSSDTIMKVGLGLGLGSGLYVVS